MAGDWIKIELTTPDKPEVVTIAAALKIEQDAVVGKLLRIWIWADQNSVDGNGMTVTEAFLDRLTQKRGFASAMRKAGWLEGVDGELSFPGFLRHNGASAKARADTNRRVADHRKRNKNVTAEALQKPLPEKRREEKRRSEDADASSEAAAKTNAQLAEMLCLAHPMQARTGPALAAAMDALKRHVFEDLLAGTVAYATAVDGWTELERIQFVKNPEAFFREDIWRQPADNWRSRIKAKQTNGQNVRPIDIGGRHHAGVETAHLK